MGEQLRGSTTAIDSSNIGFQLLKKHGWKEGTGLGISEQGRLDPVETYVKNNKRGLGATARHNELPVKKKKKNKTTESSSSKDTNNEDRTSSRKSKALSKKLRKMQELEKRLQEKEFDRAFYREFWPDNV